MVRIDYDNDPKLSTEKRIQNLAESVGRAVEEIYSEIDALKASLKKEEEKHGI